MTVGQLDLSGTGGGSDLFGSIAGVDGPDAAWLGRRNPGPEAGYLFNDCVIATISCGSGPTAFLLVPRQSASALTVLIPLPDLVASVQFITPEEVAGRRPGNPDEPVIDIYDEERLRAQTANPYEPATERCPDHSSR